MVKFICGLILVILVLNFVCFGNVVQYDNWIVSKNVSYLNGVGNFVSASTGAKNGTVSFVITLTSYNHVIFSLLTYDNELKKSPVSVSVIVNNMVIIESLNCTVSENMIIFGTTSYEACVLYGMPLISTMQAEKLLNILVRVESFTIKVISGNKMYYFEYSTKGFINSSIAMSNTVGK